MSSSSSTSSSATYILHHQLRPAPAPAPASSRAQRSPLLKPLPVCEETAAAPPSAPPPDLLELSNRYEDILNRRWRHFCSYNRILPTCLAEDNNVHCCRRLQAGPPGRPRSLQSLQSGPPQHCSARPWSGELWLVEAGHVTPVLTSDWSSGPSPCPGSAASTSPPASTRSRGAEILELSTDLRSLDSVK